ncbi:hypothetical protein POTOM_023547 [Populus tomentosa]|uniref:Uncharacterized protein n=1 Tax=Populus tomentosa TaxID=118781 RepID=A0A8X7ZN50_POPTO|nr:hypothetical protein POTOM_023547 [Populus tomentosa]
MPINKDPSTPPPMIGKIGPYTVFVTPPSTPSPKSAAANESTFPVYDSPKKVVSPPPVQPPPQQIDKSVCSHQVSDGSVLGLFKNAVNKGLSSSAAHSSLDDHLARWFGLNQSKYQWALDDYYETKGLILFWLFSYDAYVALTLVDISMVVHRYHMLQTFDFIDDRKRKVLKPKKYLAKNASGCLSGPLCKFLRSARLNFLLAAAANQNSVVH